ncbi:unnamed protein product [Schistosoma turkestanicum]|nr:unnamed protein product [Schistosoma turkestanicum]
MLKEKFDLNSFFHELLDIPQLEKGEALTLSRCVEHFNQITRWAKGMLFILAPKLIEKYSTLNSSIHQTKSVSRKSLFDNFRKCHTSTSESTVTNKKSQNKLNVERTDDDLHSDLELTNDDHTMNENFVKKSNSLHRDFNLLSTQHKRISMKKIDSVNVMLLKICEILKHLKQLHNFSSFLALLLAIQELPECLLSKKSKQMVASFSSYMKPPNFGEYRKDLETSALPCLPYLGLIFQQLIHLHIGNPIHLTNSPTTPTAPSSSLCKNDMVQFDSEFNKEQLQHDSAYQAFKPLKMITASSNPTSSYMMINVWRCWKHYMILGYFIKRKEGSVENLHQFPHNLQINRTINNFQDQFNDSTLDKAKEQLISIVQRSKRSILMR